MLKSDLEKAYDRLEWAFVEETLIDASLPLSLLNVIMGLLRKSSCCLLRNGESTDLIMPSQGLRQDDPLSPYIFVLCLERLNSGSQRRSRKGSGDL